MNQDITQPASDVPRPRISACNSAGVNVGARFVVYWMTAQRRANWNFALDRAVDWAEHLQKPLLVVEVLGCENRWASERHHRFVIEGMVENVRQFADSPVSYLPYIESRAGEGRELFRAICRSACLVVTDDYPLPLDLDSRIWMANLPIRLEKIDSVGFLPMAAAEEAFETAAAFRRFLQRHLREHLLDAPRSKPFSRRELPVLKRLPAEIASLCKSPQLSDPFQSKYDLDILPIDHAVMPVDSIGGTHAARAVLARFLRKRLSRYHEARNDIADNVASGLSPYLHFGHLSSHEIFRALRGGKHGRPRGSPIKSPARGKVGGECRRQVKHFWTN